MVIEMKDDVIGSEKARELVPKPQAGHKSLATTITQERIQVLNKSLQKKITLNIHDLKDSENELDGTRIRIEIPLSVQN